MTAEETIYRRGYSDGRAAGSWVINGNTSDKTCAEIFRKVEEGEAADFLPTLSLGEWANDPNFPDILAQEKIVLCGCQAGEAEEDDLWYVYSDAWYEGVYFQVGADCRKRLGLTEKSV